VSDTDLHPMKQVPAASDFAAVFSGLIAWEHPSRWRNNLNSWVGSTSSWKGMKKIMVAAAAYDETYFTSIIIDFFLERRLIKSISVRSSKNCACWYQITKKETLSNK
jgi:hypothetical protein